MSIIRKADSLVPTNVEYNKFQGGYIYWMPKHPHVNDKYTGIHVTEWP